MNHGRTTERADFDGVESESCGGCRRNIGNASCVAGPARRLEVGVVADGLQGLVEPVVAEFQAETRIECDHLVPGRDLVDPIQHFLAVPAEDVDELGVEMGPALSASHVEGRLGASRKVKGLDVVCQLHDASR